MKCIVVTTAKKQIESAKQEADECIRMGAGMYVRNFTKNAPVEIGDRIYFVMDGYMRGYGVVCGFKNWGRTALMEASSWTWVKPVEYADFNKEYKPLNDISKYQEAGGWLQPMPSVKPPPYSCPQEAAGTGVCVYPLCKCRWLF